MEENNQTNIPNEQERVWQKQMAERDKSRAKFFAEQELKRKRLSKFFRGTSYALIFVTFTALIYYFVLKNNDKENDIYSLSNRITLLDSTVHSLQVKTHKLEFQQTLQPNYLIDSLTNIKMIKEINLKIIQNQIKELKKDLEAINSIIIDNPKKILTVPLLKKDLENLTQVNDKKHFEFERMIQKTESNLMWYFGILFSFITALVALGISIILNAKSEKMK